MTHDDEPYIDESSASEFLTEGEVGILGRAYDGDRGKDVGALGVFYQLPQGFGHCRRDSVHDDVTCTGVAGLHG